MCNLRQAGPVSTWPLLSLQSLWPRALQAERSAAGGTAHGLLSLEKRTSHLLLLSFDIISPRLSVNLFLLSFHFGLTLFILNTLHCHQRMLAFYFCPVKLPEIFCCWFLTCSLLMEVLCACKKKTVP